MQVSNESKSVRLARFLQELIQLRTKSVRDVSAYETVLWCSEVPRDPRCFTRSWGDLQEDDPDLWLEVRRADEPQRPKPPELCELWVDEECDLSDTQGRPRLLERILKPIDADEEEEPSNATASLEAEPHTQPDSEVDGAFQGPDEAIPPDEPEFLHLEDHPEVAEAWNLYIRDQWEPWAEEHDHWKSIQHAYSTLFEIYQRIQSRGENVELVFCTGLLSWKTQGASIRRHLVTARVELSFMKERGWFQLRPATDGVNLSAELDMLPPDLRPTKARESAEQGLAAAADDLWDRAAVDPVLSSLAHLLSDHGEYHPDAHARSASLAEHPSVEFAPAVILRKRSTRGIQECLAEILRQLEEGAEPPAGWTDLTEGNSGVKEWGGSGGNGEGAAGVPAEVEEVFFPLATNDEQRRIIGALGHPIGALVQGPPGTGKSHTIANLICHLLATGKRILITAQTPRALQVLREKLPKEIRPLAVSLLGAGVEEKLSLEESVQGITTRFDDYAPGEHESKADDLKGRRGKHKRELAQLQARHRSIREADIRRHSVAGYEGTAEELAKAIARDRDHYGWLEDRVSLESTLEVSAGQVLEAVQTLRTYGPEELELLQTEPPVVGARIPEPEHFAIVVASESEAKRHAEIRRGGSDEELYRELSQRDLGQVAVVRDALRDLDVAISNARKRPQAWIGAAVQAMLTEQDLPWHELHRETQESLRGLRERARELDRVAVRLPEGKDRQEVRHDAESLLGFVGSKGQPRLWITKPAPVKRARYLTTDVSVDGAPCGDAAALEKLIAWLDMTIVVDRLWGLWADKARPHAKAWTMQVTELEELNEALGECVDVYDAVEAAMAAINDLQGIAEPPWTDEEARRTLLAAAERLLAQQQLASIQAEIEGWTHHLSLLASREQVDRAAVDQARATIESRDVTEYQIFAERLAGQNRRRDAYTRASRVLDRLAALVPLAVDTMRATLEAPHWDDRLSRLEDAVQYKQLETWLEVFLGEEDLDELERMIRRAERQIAALLETEAAARAWGHAFGRMSEDHRRALTAWQQAMKALGKGTGKYASRHRREAQRQLQKCRPAIPAWIMPLHRVFDSIRPEPGMFDVIIVDEASQCGVDALPLFFLGKKVLIVGDDKQISPSYVGLNREQVNQRLKEFLPDYEHQQSFSVERSLFDQGELRIGNRIVLREHFRCMPEIIRFSNDLCYSNTPLIPLRQYPPDRLSPLESRYLDDGYREGSGQSVLNRPEAERVVKAIAACCDDERYERDGRKLTMGVISLQGRSQAEYIEHLLLQAIGAEEMVDRRLICGDAYSFQGDERDVVFLSLVAAPNERIGPLTRTSDHQRFNVAASRAKDQCWLFHSAQAEDLSETCVRRRLVEYFADPERFADRIQGVDVDRLRAEAMRMPRARGNQPAPFDSWFEVDVALDIAGRGYKVIPQLEVAERGSRARIDLVVEGGMGRLAVECDGDFWHGPEQYDEDVARQRKLERAGWRFHRIRGSEYYANRERVLGHLWESLSEVGITPIGNEPLAAPFTSVSLRPESSDDEGESVWELEQDQPEASRDSWTPKPVVEDDGEDLDELEDTTEELPATDVLVHDGRLVSYETWSAEGIPDPRQARSSDVVEHLCDIVKVEGPIPAGRAFQLYAKAAGLQRVGSQVRRVLETGLQRARRQGRIEAVHELGGRRVIEMVLRMPDSPVVRPRHKGPRKINEIPPRELAWMMKEVKNAKPSLQGDELFKQVLLEYGFQRMRSVTRDYLASVYQTLLTPGEREGGADAN